MSAPTATGDGRTVQADTSRWRARPVLHACLGVLIGTGLGLREPWHSAGWAALAVAGAVAVTALRGRGPALALAVTAALALGAWRAGAVTAEWERRPLRHWLDRPVVLDGLVREPPEATDDGGRVVVEVDRIAPPGERWRPLRGAVRLRVPSVGGLACGDRLRVWATLAAGRTAGNPGVFSQRAWLRRQGIDAVGELSAVELLARRRGATLARLSERWRDRLVRSLRETMPGPASAEYADLLAAMVYGLHAAPVDERLEAACRRVGVVHVLVASGTQVSLLLGLVLLVCRLLPMPFWTAFGAAAAVVGGYVVVTGFEPAILRAALMGLVLFGAILHGRDHDLATALGLTAAVMVLANPLQLRDVGFQLSFAATAGMVALGLPLARRVTGPWRYPAGVAALTVGAQAYVAPVLIYHFRELSLVGLPANLPVIPLSGLLVVLGLGASACGLVAAPVAGALNAVAHWLLAGFVAMVGWFDSLPGGFRSPLVMTPAQLAGMVLLLGVVTMAMSPGAWRWSGRRAALAALGLLAVGSAWSTWRLATGRLEVAVLDVGNGDCVLVRTPSGRCLLVDGGPYAEYEGTVRDAGREQVVPALMLAGVRTLAGVVATHQHADHLGGLATVLTAFPTERLWLPDLDSESLASARLLQAAADSRLEPETLRRGQVFDLGDGVRVYALWPPAEPVTGTDSEVNNNAVVLKVIYGGVSFLLASDLEARGEAYLLRHAGDLSATVLKVPHQGAADSCSAEWLEQVAPRYAVVSVGPNAFGHPAPAVLRRLAERDIRVHRTDRDGMVTYRTDGRTISVSTAGRH